MTDMSCTTAREWAPEFAFGVLETREQAEMQLHLEHCTRCQAFVDSLTEVVDVLPQLTPEIEPPFGFDRRLRAAMGARQRRSTRRWISAIAVAAAAAAVVSIGVVRVVDADREGVAEAAPPQRTIAMRSNGVRVGAVTVAGHERVALAVNVEYAVPDGSYTLELRRGATTSRLGHLAVTRSHGEWTGTATLPRNDDATLAMVDADGHDVCSAALTALAAS